MAQRAIEAGGNGRRAHAWEDAVTTNINAATCLIYRYAPLAEVQAMLPDVVATIDEQLPRTDLRRTAADDILRRLQKANGKAALTEAERGVIVAAVRTAYSALEREYLRIRSFRRLILVVSGFPVIAVVVAVTAALYPTVLPICFTPEAKVVCATEEARLAGGDVDAVVAVVASSWDYAVLELVGLVAAAVAAAATLRQVKGTSTPFDIPVALAILKLPTGALTALLGLLLMRGQFVPGLSNLDTSAQIVAWALVFGYAQQLFTRMVDERGQAVLAAVAAPRTPRSPERHSGRTVIPAPAGSRRLSRGAGTVSAGDQPDTCWRELVSFSSTTSISIPRLRDSFDGRVVLPATPATTRPARCSTASSTGGRRRRPAGRRRRGGAGGDPGRRDRGGAGRPRRRPQPGRAQHHRGRDRARPVGHDRLDIDPGGPHRLGPDRADRRRLHRRRRRARAGHRVRRHRVGRPRRADPGGGSGSWSASTG